MESYSGKILHKANRLTSLQDLVWHLDFRYRRQHPLKYTTPTLQRSGKSSSLVWENYALVTELNKKSEPVQVATLLTLIGEEAREVNSTFNNWAEDGDDKKIKPVLKKLRDYCAPRKNSRFQRYKFNRRVQEPGETYDQYRFIYLFHSISFALKNTEKKY